MSVDFVDNSAQLLAAFRDACERGLWRCGEKAEEYAKDLAPVDTGKMCAHRVHIKPRWRDLLRHSLRLFRFCHY